MKQVGYFITRVSNARQTCAALIGRVHKLIAQFNKIYNL